MILSKNCKVPNGNFLVIIGFIATSFVLFFTLFSYIAKSYLVEQQGSEISAQAVYAAESSLEKMTYEYNQNITLNPANTIYQKIDNICKNYSFNLFETNNNQAVIDFGKNCEDEDKIIVEVGGNSSKIIKNASRMIKKESAYLDRYQLFEYRLTRSEFLESFDGESYPRPVKLKISWKNDNLPADKNPKIEFILASWETQADNKINSNIAIQRLVPIDDQVLFDSETRTNSYELFDLSAEDENTPLFCDTDCGEEFIEKEYYLFIKSFHQPLHINIQGFKNIDDTEETLQEVVRERALELDEAMQNEDKDEIREAQKILVLSDFKIPSRYLFLEASAIIENEQTPLDNHIKKVQSQRQFYTDFDSNFPYVKYEIR